MRANLLPSGEKEREVMGSAPSWWSPTTSLVRESSTTHFPVTVPARITSPSGEKHAD